MNTITMPFHKLMALCVLATLGSGCIVAGVPIQVPDEKPFKDDRLAFIEIGTTTKAQVATTMSNFTVLTDEGEKVVALRPLKLKGGDWWLYKRDRATWQWAGCIIFIDGDCGTTDVGSDHRFLLIKFDERGVVSDYDVSSLGSDGCNSSGICMQKGSFTFLASAEEDDLAKGFHPLNDGCSVYMYAKVGVMSGLDPLPVSVTLDDNPAFSLIDREGFLHWRVVDGPHQINIKDRYSYRGSLVPEIDCQQGDILFIKYSRKRSASLGSAFIAAFAPTDKREIETFFGVVEYSEGRREIKKRRLVLMD